MSETTANPKSTTAPIRIMAAALFIAVLAFGLYGQSTAAQLHDRLMAVLAPIAKHFTGG